jgi:two-component system, chemotaxis family, CheB/CheR fusion protein
MARKRVLPPASEFKPEAQEKPPDSFPDPSPAPTAAPNAKTGPKPKAKPRRRAKQAAPAPPLAPLVVGVGASAGGLEAFSDLLRHLPQDTGMAFILLQHLPPKQHSMLAAILGRVTTLPVAEALDGTVPEADHVYILPPGEVMELREGALHLVSRDISEGRYLPVDTFLKSLAAEQGSLAIGVILSGTASDGVQGMKAIKEAGGITFAQDEQTAKYPGMPQSSVAAGCVDFILTPEAIAQELARIAQHPYTGPAIATGLWRPEEESTFGQIFTILRRSTGVDFSLYKHSTIMRRTYRRMALKKIDTLEGYVEYLKHTPEEVKALYTDVLINVTSFLRDPEVFAGLHQLVFPALMQNRLPDAPIRVWVPGCSTGEEVYSLALALMEFFAETDASVPLQIFGTDIDAAAIEVARAGKYKASSTSSIPPELLKRYFTKVDGDYQIQKSIRDRCTFASQNLVEDPPFSHLDLISCRNVLIYLGPVLQKKVMPIFHFALKPNGFLLLGKSEAIGPFQELFTPVDKKFKIYARKAIRGRSPLKFALSTYPEPELPEPMARKLAPSRTIDLTKEADRIVLARFVPPGVVVDEQFKIVQFRGHTGPYLEPMPGEASLNLLRMLREGLRPEVGAALHLAVKGGTPVRKEALSIKYNGQVREINVEVFPISPGILQERFYLVVFEDVACLTKAEPGPTAVLPKRGKAAKDNLVLELERDLAATKDYLQATIQEQEATLEELKSTNEEILSSNEELQSLNEEMEASREELQAVNEELATVNEELENRNVELSQANDDLNNLLGSVNIPILFLDQHLSIRRFNTVAKEVLHLIPSDVGRSIGDLNLALDINDFEVRLREVIDTLKIETREVQDRQGHWYSLQIRPYKTAAHKIDGLVLTLADIDDLKHSLQEAEAARIYAQAIVETQREPLVILDGDLKVVSANRAFYEFFHVAPQETEHRLIYELGERQWDLPDLRTLLEKILPQDAMINNFPVDVDFPTIGHRVMLLNARQMKKDPAPNLILLAMEDVTARKEMETALLESERKLRALNAELLVAQECERAAVSLALHEELAQKLVALKLKLRNIAPNLPQEQSQPREDLDEAFRTIDGLIEETRELSWGLRPQVLDLGLTPAVQHLLGQFRKYFEIETDIGVKDLDQSFAPQTQVIIYRVLQEALVNVLKHARASQVSLKIANEDQQVRFQVADNGVGFQMSGSGGVDFCRTISPDKGWLVGGVPFKVSADGTEFTAVPEAMGGEGGRKMGLALMEGRVRFLQGTFAITSEAGQGTRVEFTVPMDKKE